MAVTRIKNNQVTDAASGNTIVGINAGTKLQPYSITATRIANNLTYGSDLTITGNLTVQGTTTNVDTVNTLIQDPLITLADGQTSGTPTLDIGTIGLRGSQQSAVLAWKESAKEFVTALSSTTVSNTTFTLSTYANLHSGNTIHEGTTSLIGNVIGTNTNFTGNITGGNLLTPGQVSATANVTGGNLLTSGLISATSTITSAANITGGNLLTAGLISATSTITSAANVIGGNVTTAGQVSATGNITTAGAFNGATLSLSGNVTSALNITGNVTGGNILSPGIMSSTGNITGGNVLTGGQVSATANVTGGNIVTAGQVTTPSLVGTTGLAVTTGSGNITLTPAGNVVLSSKYINGLNQPVQDNDAASKIYVDNLVSTQITYHAPVSAATVSNLATATGGTVSYNQPNGVGNGIGAYIQTTGAFTTIDTANVQTVGTRILVKDEGNATFNGVYVYSNATAITRSTDADEYGPNSTEQLSLNDYFFVQGGNINEGSAWIVSAPNGAITFGSSNIQFAQFSQSQVYDAGNGIAITGTTISVKTDNNTTSIDGGGNVIVKAGANLTTPNIGAATGTSLSVTGTVTAASTVGGVITGSTASLSGNVTGGNVLTGGLISATGNITTAAALNGATLSLSGNVTSPLNVTGNITGGNLLTPGLISATATITGGNLATGGTASATGNITGGNILSGGLISTTGSATHGNIVITGNSVNMLNPGGTIQVNGAGANTNFSVSGTGANVFFVNGSTNSVSFGSSTQTTNAIAAFNTTTSILIPAGTQVQRPGTGVTGMMRFNSTTNALEIYNNTQWQSVGSTVFTVIADEQFNGDGTTTAYTLASTQTTASCIVSINGVVQIPTLAYSVSGTTLTFTEAPAAGDVIDVRELTTTTTLLSLQNVSANASIQLSDTTNIVTITGVANITGDLNVSGNATILGNVATNQIINGTSGVLIPTPNGNVIIDVGSTNDIATFTTDSMEIHGNIVPQSNVTYTLGTNTLRWKDLYLSGNSIFLGNATISANATALIMTNPAGGQTVLAGATTTSSVAGNITGGNILTGGIVSAVGNIITGTNLGSPGWIGVGTATPDAEITILANPQTSTYTLTGSSTTLGTDLHIVGADATQTRIVQDTFGTGAYVAFTGRAARGTAASPTQTQSGDTIAQFTGRGFSSGSLQFGNASTGRVDLVAAENFTDTSRATNVTVFTTASGAITPTAIATFSSALGLSIPSIVNSGANGVGNIGNSTTYFNTVFAKATSAQYADLAEKYTADAEYAPGTVVVFGGTAEVTVNAVEGDRKVAGVVSTNPSYTMNSGLEAEHVATVALTGRVPCMVVGPVKKGDLMVAAGLGRAKAEADPRVGAVIGKALEDFDGTEGTIEVVVGRC
jgi:filamentous hemagglutinin